MKKLFFIGIVCLVLQSCTKSVPQQKTTIPNLGKNY